jgi:RNA polymerase sigma factor (sigma-70 family)
VTVTTGPGTTDADLVARCIDGDARAWDALVERHGPLVWAVAHRAGLSDADAADVFQNTWAIAVEELDRVRRPEQVVRWIGRVARHQAMRVRRGYGIARRARERIAREDVDMRVPDEELAALERRSLMDAALAAVGGRCADLLQALYYERPSPAYADLADRLGMRIGSIGPTRARCLEKLRKELGSDPDA